MNLTLALEPTPALAGVPCISTPARTDRPDNLRLAKLLAEWETRRRKSPARARALVDRFLEEVEALGGSPLIEHAGRSRGCYHRGEAWRVTFLWDGRQHPADQVALHAGLPSLAPADTVFRPLGDTGLSYLSLVLPEGAALSYYLVAGPAQALDSDDQETLRNWVEAYRLVDPLNPRTWPDRADPLARARLASLPAGQPGRVYSLATVPGVAPADCLVDVPLRGQWQHARLRSAFLGNERDIYLYRPARVAVRREDERTGEALTGNQRNGDGRTRDQRDEDGRNGVEPDGDGPLRLLFVFDGEAWETQYLGSLALDLLQSQGRIASTVVVFVSNVDRDGELPPNADFARFMANELLPWARMQVDGATSSPAQVIASGFSFGGLAATWLGYREPDAFGNVLSSSGSFWWTPSPERPQAMLDKLVEADSPPGDDWLTRQFISAPRLPVRFYLSAGRLETGADGMAGILDNHRRIRDVLRARGYQVRDREGPGGHEYLEWARALVAGLPTLIPAEGPTVRTGSVEPRADG